MRHARYLLILLPYAILGLLMIAIPWIERYELLGDLVGLVCFLVFAFVAPLYALVAPRGLEARFISIGCVLALGVIVVPAMVLLIGAEPGEYEPGTHHVNMLGEAMVGMWVTLGQLVVFAYAIWTVASSAALSAWFERERLAKVGLRIDVALMIVAGTTLAAVGGLVLVFGRWASLLLFG